MTLAPNLTDKEHGKFRDNAAGPVVAVSNADGSAISAGGGGGTSSVDKATMVEATSSYTPTGGVFNDSLGAIASGVGAWFRLTAFRALHINVRDASGNEIASGTSNTDTGQRALYVRNLGASGGGSSGPTSPQRNQASAAAVAAGGTSGTSLRSVAITTAKTGKLALVTVASTTAMRADLQTVAAGVATTVETRYAQAGEPIEFAPPSGYVSQAAGSAFTGFQVTATNLDPTSSADQEATFYWDEV